MILVTGATGRIGNVLLRELAKKKEGIRILVRDTSDLSPLKGIKYEVAYGDIRDYTAVSQAVSGCSYVYHLAGFINISNKNKNVTFDTNVEGTENIIKACKEHKVKRLLYVSSIHAFEIPNQNKIIDETTPFCDVNSSRGLYDRSKSMATCKVLQAAKDGLNVVVVCPTGVIGPYDYRPSFFGQGLIDSIKNGLKYTVPGGYDYVDVRDVADGILRAMDKGKTGEVYILGGEYLSMERYYKTLKKLAKIRVKSQLLPHAIARIIAFFSNLFIKNASITPYSLSTLMSNSNISHEKASRDLGYKPMSVEKSITDQYNWFLKEGMLNS